MAMPQAENPRKRRKILLARGPFVLLLSLLFVLGALGGFFLALGLDPLSVRLKESPFGPDLVSRLPKGAPFDGLEALSALPEGDRGRYLELIRLYEAGDRAEAAAGAAVLAASHPGHPLVAGAAAFFHLRPGPLQPPEAARAATLLEPALSAHPAEPWLLYVKGLLHEASGRADSALSAYADAIRVSPQFAYAHAASGRIHLDRGVTGRAAASFRKAIALMSTFPGSYRGVSGAGNGATATALPAAESVPIDWLATLYMQAGSADSARMALEYGLENGWNTPRMALVQGWMWEASGFLQKADSTYRALLEADPDNPDYAQALATLGWKPIRPPGAGQPGGKASRKGEASAEPPPGDEEAQAAFAISVLDPLARQYPGNGPLWMALGQAYHRRGLFAPAADAFDTAFRADSTLPGLRDMRAAARLALMREDSWERLARERAGGTRKARSASRAAPIPEADRMSVIIPGTIALLGTYSVPWGSTQLDVRKAYPDKIFRNLPDGSLVDEFVHDGVRHEYLLGFKEGRLWGVRVFVTDSAGTGGDLFGRLIRVKTKISGEGKGTGEAACPGFLPFQGAIWENDDTFEFMAQFQGKDNQIRLARLDRGQLPYNRRLCDLVHFLKAETWEPGKAPPPPKPAAKARPKDAPEKASTPAPAAPRGDPLTMRRPAPIHPPPEPAADAGQPVAPAVPVAVPASPPGAAPSIIVPPGVDPYRNAPDVTE
jgi:tetratricopeptide (TPR) repeat protein